MTFADVRSNILSEITDIPVDKAGLGTQFELHQMDTFTSKWATPPHKKHIDEIV